VDFTVACGSFINLLKMSEMKRNDQMVPGFDEIIFENRNRSYGAFDLRRRYKSAAGLSILGGVTLFTIPLILFFTFSPEPVTAKSDPGIYIVVKPDNLIHPDNVIPPEPEKPLKAPPVYKYVEPKVVDDTSGLTNMMVNDIANDSVRNDIVTLKTDAVIYAPLETDVAEEPEPLVFVEERPVFPGGNSALLKYISEHTIYPAEALENNIEGRVFLRFVVASDGSVKRIEIIRGLNPLLDAEAIRVVSTLPAWKPGRQNGIAVPVWFTIPVTFKIMIN
jgi:protein TonB